MEWLAVPGVVPVPFRFGDHRGAAPTLDVAHWVWGVHAGKDCAAFDWIRCKRKLKRPYVLWIPFRSSVVHAHHTLAPFVFLPQYMCPHVSAVQGNQLNYCTNNRAAIASSCSLTNLWLLLGCHCWRRSSSRGFRGQSSRRGVFGGRSMSQKEHQFWSALGCLEYRMFSIFFASETPWRETVQKSGRQTTLSLPLPWKRSTWRHLQYFASEFKWPASKTSMRNHIRDLFWSNACES